MKRAVFLDIAKAICIVLVVVGHSPSIIYPEWYKTFILGIYTFHMPLFMFASGFIYNMTKNDDAYGTFLMKKVRRLVIPYFICSFILIFIKLITQDFAYVRIHSSLISFINVLYKPEAGRFLWFVWALWWMFVIIPFFKTRKQRLILFAIAMFIHFYPERITEVLCLNSTKKMLVYFMAGVITFDYKAVFSKFKQIPLYIYAILFVVVECLYFSDVRSFSWMKFLLAFIGIAFILSLSKEIEKIKSNGVQKVFRILSVSSYFVYLFHTTFEGLAKAILVKASFYEGTISTFSFCMSELFIIAFGLIFPILIYQFVVVRFKTTKFLFGLK